MNQAGSACAHNSYQASFEACFVDLESLEKLKNFNSTVGKEQKPSQHSSPKSHKASPFGHDNVNSSYTQKSHQILVPRLVSVLHKRLKRICHSCLK